jgi:hypothetical protein
MNISTAHSSARAAAARLPALQASFNLLDNGAGQARIDFFDSAQNLLASLPLRTTPGILVPETFQIQLSVPVEVQIGLTGEATSAKVYDNTGGLWADDLTVTNSLGTGDIRLEDTLLRAGSFLRLVFATFQG